MPRRIPYLARRGDQYAFRLSVPIDLRAIIGKRELTKSLGTTDKHVAIPRALRLAAEAKRLFFEIRHMASGREVVPKRGKVDSFRVDFGFELDLGELGKITLTDLKPEDKGAVNEIVANTIDGLTKLQQASPVRTSAHQHETAPNSPLLSTLIDRFLEDQAGRNIAAMMKKHRAVLPIFIEIVGDKPVSQLRQTDIVDYFTLVQKLPPRWKDIRDKQKLSIRQIAGQNHAELMAEGTFSGTYRASVSIFIDWAVTNHQDAGFPTALTVSKIEYRGNRKKGTQQKQRALTSDELKHLFEGPEMAGIAADDRYASRYWLLHALLFTGARINELCQLNPQTDIRKDPTGIWYIRIADDTEAAPDVVKSVKTSTAREVPIHPTLIELGICGYIEQTKGSGSKLLFPEWQPRDGRASKNAERWLVRHFKAIGLHGVQNEKGHALRGAHAFRHTLLSYGKRQALNLRCISGHAESSDNKVADGYEDETITLPLSEKKARLDQLDYGIQFFKPVGVKTPP